MYTEKRSRQSFECYLLTQSKGKKERSQMSNVKWLRLFYICEYALLHVTNHLDTHSSIEKKCFIFLMKERFTKQCKDRK